MIEPTSRMMSTAWACHETNAPVSHTEAKAVSLPTNPRVTGMPAMLAPATAAVIASPGRRWPSRASLRTSRVPVEWSMMPTTMNNDALNNACATSIAMPAMATFASPMPTSTAMKPSWDTVPNARMSLRSSSRSERHPPSTIVTRPSPTTAICQLIVTEKAGARRAMR